MIQGFFVPAVLPQPLVLVAVRIDAFGPDIAAVPFVIDTGAAHTCITAQDSLHAFGQNPADLDSAAWPDAVELAGVGGSLRAKVSPASFWFRNTDGSVEMLSTNIRIGDMRSGALPSLLGWDLLKSFRLVVDGPAQTATLEGV